MTLPVIQPSVAPTKGMTSPKANKPADSMCRFPSRLRPADRPMSSRNRQRIPVKGVTMKGAIISIPSPPVTAPMAKAPVSRTIEPLASRSRHKRLSEPGAAPPLTRCASHSADRMAGTSIAAATATM